MSTKQTQGLILYNKSAHKVLLLYPSHIQLNFTFLMKARKSQKTEGGELKQIVSARFIGWDYASFWTVFTEKFLSYNTVITIV